MKEPTGFFKNLSDGRIDALFLITFSINPAISLRSKWWVFLKELSICPLGKVWVSCLKSLKKPSIYPLGKTPLPPVPWSRYAGNTSPVSFSGCHIPSVHIEYLFSWARADWTGVLESFISNTAMNTLKWGLLLLVGDTFDTMKSENSMLAHCPLGKISSMNRVFFHVTDHQGWGFLEAGLQNLLRCYQGWCTTGRRGYCWSWYWCQLQTTGAETVQIYIPDIPDLVEILCSKICCSTHLLLFYNIGQGPLVCGKVATQYPMGHSGSGRGPLLLTCINGLCSQGPAMLEAPQQLQGAAGDPSSLTEVGDWGGKRLRSFMYEQEN